MMIFTQAIFKWKNTFQSMNNTFSDRSPNETIFGFFSDFSQFKPFHYDAHNVLDFDFQATPLTSTHIK